MLALGDFLGTPFSSLASFAADLRSQRGLCDADLPTSHPFAPEESFRDSRKMQECVPPSKHHGSAGILTCCPSTTPFGLALGPTNPGTILVALETLGLRGAGFSPAFLLLMPTFSLHNAPPHLTVRLQRRYECSLTAHVKNDRTRDFGRMLSPGKFSAQSDLTSELLRFL